MGPQFNGTADYDCIVQATFKDIQDFVKMKADPFFREKVAPDHENFADTVRSKYVILLLLAFPFPVDLNTGKAKGLLINSLQDDRWMD